MKLLKVLAVMLVVMMLGTSALAGAPGSEEVKNLANSIGLQMQTNKYMDSDWEEMYFFQGYTTAQICEAIEIALGELTSESWATEECIASYENYLAANDVCYHFYHGALIRDLGDESVPMYALCALAAVALGGVVIAHKKRVCA